MVRLISTERPNQERTQLIRGVVVAVRRLMSKTGVDEETRDLASFISQALIIIWDSIEASVASWEKRGYWIKADRFRMEWIWSQKLGLEMQQAILREDWTLVAQLSEQVAIKFGDVKLPKRHRLGTPWAGAWKRLNG